MTYVSYDIIRRDQIPSLKGWDASVARDIFNRHAHIQQVHFCRRSQNDSQSRYRPAPGTAIYVKSTGGSWGKSKILRIARSN
jgi:hypothetical protein